MEEVAAVAVPGFSVTASVADRHLQVSMNGSAENLAQSVIAVLLPKLHDIARSRCLESVVVDMRTVDFMNSGCIKEFVTWLLKIEDLERAHQYRVKLVENPRHHWQQRTFQVLKSFAMDIVEIER